MFEVIRKICQTKIATVSPTHDKGLKYCRGELVVQADKCNNCKSCVKICPAKAIEIFPDKSCNKVVISYERCIFCGVCAQSCKTKALQISGKHCQPIKQADEPEMANKASKASKMIFKKSLHIRHVDSGSCNGCDFEMNMLTSPVYDIQRFGIDFVASPRHADMLMVTGGVTRHLEEAVYKTFNAAASPKIVVAVGACACAGGTFGASYAGNTGVDKIVPVFMKIPGCPPSPSALIEAILTAMEYVV